MFENLRDEAATLGRPAWRDMLVYFADLHGRSVHQPCAPFEFSWEEIGPGYCYGPAFGHWDIIHAVLDTLTAEPEHGERQIRNLLATQQPDGCLPCVLMLRDGEFRFSTDVTHPPVWPIAADAIARQAEDRAFLADCLSVLKRQIAWFEANRLAADGGFYYLDVVEDKWESGVDEGVRFLHRPPEPLGCVDASSHVYSLYDHAASWSETLGEDAAPWRLKADALRDYVRTSLFDADTGFFYDAWSVNQPNKRVMSYEGIWPLVCGIATNEQAARVIDENLLNPDRFLTTHPVCTVGRREPAFELRMWRGPTWNSMTYWAVRGCALAHRFDAAHTLAERALDASAAQFARTGTVWEFYHPDGGKPEDIARKPHTQYNQPCRDYLGHNPLIALARYVTE